MIAIQAALAHRANTGEGQHIDLALLDVQTAALANQASNFLVSGRAPGRLGNAHPNIVPYEGFATSDGYIVLAVGNDAQFARFCDLAGCPELATDPRFATNPKRVINREVLVPIIEECMRARSSADWLEALEAADVPCGPINDIGQLFADPQAVARGLRIELPEKDLAGVPTGQTIPGVASPMRFSQSPVSYSLAPPRLGQHTLEVLREELDMSEPELERVRAAGVIGT